MNLAKWSWTGLLQDVSQFVIERLPAAVTAQTEAGLEENVAAAGERFRMKRGSERPGRFSRVQADMREVMAEPSAGFRQSWLVKTFAASCGMQIPRDGRC